MLSILKKLFRPQNKEDKAAPSNDSQSISTSVDSRYTGLVDAVQSGWFLQDSGELFSGFAITSDDIVLDVGCGEGAASRFCANQGATVIFSDTEQSTLTALARQLENTIAKNTCPILCETNPLPLPDNSVSKIISMEMLEHVDHPKQIIAELARVGKPGAQYLISVPAAAGEELQKTIAPKGYYQTPNHIHIFQSEQFEKLITDAGLIIEQSHQSGFYWLMWMCMFWASEYTNGKSLKTAIREEIAPPFHPLLDNWSSVWLKLITTEEGKEVKKALDQCLPKTQIIVARKPTSTERR